VREPWRVALAYLTQLGEPAALFQSFVERMGTDAVETVGSMLRADLNCPRSSGLGRLFDAVASLAGLRDRVIHEGHAALELEGCASAVAFSDARTYPFAPDDDVPFVLDPLSIIAGVVDDVKRGVPMPHIATAFHASLVEGFAGAAKLAGERTGLTTVALSGGCMMNAVFGPALVRRLREEDFRVLTHRLVPPNDGGLSLGQAIVAATRSGGM
jgi:hydrogenase maturation protein HypF